MVLTTLKVSPKIVVKRLIFSTSIESHQELLVSVPGTVQCICCCCCCCCAAAVDVVAEHLLVLTLLLVELMVMMQELMVMVEDFHDLADQESFQALEEDFDDILLTISALLVTTVGCQEFRDVWIHSSPGLFRVLARSRLIVAHFSDVLQFTSINSVMNFLCWSFTGVNLSLSVLYEVSNAM